MPIGVTLTVVASAENVVRFAQIDVLSGSLPAVLVAVDPLNRRLVAEIERVGRGPLDGKATSLLGAKALLLLLLVSREEFALAVNSSKFEAGGESKEALVVGGADDALTAILSVEVVGGPMFGLPGDLRAPRGSSMVTPLAESFELDAVEGSLAVGASIVVPIDNREIGESWSTTEVFRLEPDPEFSPSTELEGGEDVRVLVKYSPREVFVSSERLEGLIEVESLLSLAGLEEGGGMLMLGLSMVVFVCSVPA